MPKLTHHFTTSTGTVSLTRSTRRYLVVDSDTAKIAGRTDDLEQANQVAAEATPGTHEVIDLRTHGRTAQPRQAQAPTPAPQPEPAPEPEPVFVSLGGRANMRHRPDGTGALCRPTGTATPAEGDGPLCKKCEKIDAKRTADADAA